MKLNKNRVAGIGGAAIAALGTFKTFLEVGTGAGFSLQQAGFYLGASAIAVYLGAGVAAMAAGLLIGGLTLLNGGKDLSSTIENAVLVLGFIVGLAMAVGIVMAGVLFDYQSTDSFGRGFTALLGVALLGVAIYVWRGWKSADDS